MKTCLRRGILLAGVGLAGGTAVGAEDLRDELKWIRAEGTTVSTASLRSESIAHAPATIRVVTREQIRARGYRSLYELLRDLPGIDVLDHVQAEAKHRITIRGISGNHKFLILQDGIRINSPTGENIQPVAENYPLYHVRQVEVLYGPASAIYGADAVSAVINLITESPTPEGRTEAAVEAGEFGARRVDFYSARRYSDTLAFSLGGHYQETDGPDLAREYPGDYEFEDLKRLDGEVAVPRAQRRSYTGAFNSFSTWGKLELGRNTTFGWNQSLIDTRYSEGVTPSFTDFTDHGGVLLLTGYGRHLYEIGDRITGQVQANYSRYEQLPYSHFNNQFTDFMDGFAYSLGERVEIEPQISYALERHTFTAGFTFQHFHALPHTTDLPSEYDRGRSPGDQEMFHLGSDNTLPIEIFELNYNTYGAFLQEQAQWSDRFSTTLGLRYDDNEDYGSSWNPRLGLVFEQSPQTTWKLLYGEAFLAPSPFERYENFGTFAFQQPDGRYRSYFFHVPNPDLEPEELQSVELNVAHRPWDGFEVTLAGYYNSLDEVILTTRTPQPVSDFVPGGFIEHTEAAQNVGEIESYGGELTVNQSFEWDDSRLSVWGSYSRVDGTLRDNLAGTEMDLPFTSCDLVRLGLTYTCAGRFVLTPSLRWNGPQSGLAATPGHEVRTGSFTVADLYAELRNAKRTGAVFLRVTNLFDERYHNAQRELGTFIFEESPQDPRWITAGIRISL